MERKGQDTPRGDRWEAQGRGGGSRAGLNVRRGLPKAPLPDQPGRLWGLPAPLPASKTGARRTPPRTG